jgi:hypothetical protein
VLASQHGPTHPVVRNLINRLNVVSRMELVILFLVVADMALKPTADDVGTLVLGAAIVVVTLVLGMRSIQHAGRVAQAGG